MSYRIRRLVVLAMLIAMEIVLSRVLPPVSTPILKISFAFIPVATAAILYGPLWAGCVGALADLIGALLLPIGTYFPGLTLTALLIGMIYGLFLYKRRFTVINAMLRSFGAATVVCIGAHILLNSFWLAIMRVLGLSVVENMSPSLYVNWVALVASRTFPNLIMIAVQAVSIFALLLLFKKNILRFETGHLESLRARARTYFVKNPALRAPTSEAITQRAVALPEYAAARTIFCFAGTEREIDTAALLERVLADGKLLCLPVSLRDGTMTARQIKSLGELNAVGLYGIREPDPAAPIVDPAHIDLAFVPCSAADRARNRLGKGGGYYDRYLKDTDIIKIGLCPKALQVSRLPYHEADLPMDKIVTERGVY